MTETHRMLGLLSWGRSAGALKCSLQLVAVGRHTAVPCLLDRLQLVGYQQ